MRCVRQISKVGMRTKKCDWDKDEKKKNDEENRKTVWRDYLPAISRSGTQPEQ